MEIIIVSSPESWQYVYPGHPESPDRVKKSCVYLQQRQFQFITPPLAEVQDILLVHTPSLLNQIKQGTFYDTDTPVLENIYSYALLSVGCTITAMELANTQRFVFALTRPPGHHAGKNFLGGFCYFNNLAIAVQKYVNSTGNKVAILDIDCHHGNGTEDIFFGADKVLYISLHQSPLYPGTGLTSRQNCLNFPLPPGTDETVYLKNLNTALSAITDFSPGQLAISAGFDTYRNDPLTNFNLELITYTEIARRIKKLNLPTWAVLEGGYSVDLPKIISGFITGFN